MSGIFILIMARGDRFRHDQTPQASVPARSLNDARLDAHAWIERGFNAIESVVQGVGDIIRGAGDIAMGRGPGAAYRAHSDAPNIADLGEWYVDSVIDAETGAIDYTVTNGERVVDCHTRDMAEEVLKALNERGVRMRTSAAGEAASEAADSRPGSSRRATEKENHEH